MKKLFFIALCALSINGIKAQDDVHTTQSAEVRLPNYRLTEGQFNHPMTATVSIPNGAKFVSVQGMMRNGQGTELFCSGNFGPVAGPCSEVSDGRESCACGWARMTNFQYNGYTVSADFFNWSDCDVRYAYIVVKWKY